MKHGEAPGRTGKKGPDLVRVACGLVLAGTALILTLSPTSAVVPARARRALAAAMPDAEAPAIPPALPVATSASPSASPAAAPASAVPAAVPVATTPAASPPATTAALASGQPAPVSFDLLGGFEMPRVPPEVRALDGQRVKLEGFVMPMKMAGPRLIAFMLTSFMPGCCFGQEPRLNDWVLVVVSEDLHIKASNLNFATVTGTLAVREVRDKQGELIGLYSMRATEVVATDGSSHHRQ